MSNTRGDSSARRLLRSYLDAVSLSDSVRTRLWQSSGVSLTQVRLLYELREGPLTPSAICRSLSLAPASMTRILDRLEERALVERRRDAGDRRKVDVHLTAAGRELLTQTPILRGSLLQAAAEAMPASSRERVAAALEELVEAVREVAAAPPAARVSG